MKERRLEADGVRSGVFMAVWFYQTPPRAGSLSFSPHDPMHELAMHVGEAVVAALVAEGEAFVIEAEEVEQRGVQVMRVDGVRP
jgi:hypothetical protein